MNAFPRQMKETESEPCSVSPGVRKAIIWTVILLHVCVLVIPALVFAFISWMQPKPVKAIRVALVDSPPNNNTIPSRKPGPAKLPNDNPAPGEPIPDLPENLKPVPKIKEIEPEPLPAPKPVPKVMPKPVPKPVPTPKTTPVPAPKAPAEPQPRKKHTLSANEINFTRGKTPKGRKTSQTASRSSRNSASSSDLANYIRNQAKRGGGGGTTGGRGFAGGAGGPSGSELDRYYAVVQTLLRNRWTNRPSLSTLGNARPVVRVDFVVESDGSISRIRIQKCNVPVMDQSVENLLKNLRYLPRPPKGERLSFYVNMRVED